MGITVFANGQGFFHKGSGGSGKAFPDVCLSPPPPPAGPLPIPYPNNLTASDLADGSKTVKIDGEPTALEDASYVRPVPATKEAPRGAAWSATRPKAPAVSPSGRWMSRSKAREWTVMKTQCCRIAAHEHHPMD